MTNKDYICPQCGPDPQGSDAHARNWHMLTDDSPPLAINANGLLKVCLTSPSGNSLTLKDLPKIIEQLEEQIPEIGGVVPCIKNEKGDYVELTKDMFCGVKQ